MNAPIPAWFRPACLWLAGALLAAVARADDEDGRVQRLLPPRPYVQECAACHIAYPPGMLPAASWSRLMAGLDRHYGTDAALDPADVQVVSRWLAAHADTGRRAEAAVPQDRITRTGWFLRKHRHIEADTWRLPSVRSAANCMACHSQADRGRFGDHGLRLPEGLSARQRAAWYD